jgi:hypothetical protein
LCGRGREGLKPMRMSLGGCAEVRWQPTGVRWLLVSGVLLSLLEHPAVAQAPAPPRLTTADLAWPGLTAEADSTAVRRLLGEPQAREFWFTAPDGGEAPRWRYADRAVYYDVSADWVIAVEFTRAGPSTHRGLQVGHSEARVRALYGLPTSVNEFPGFDAPPGDVWRYWGHDGVLTLHMRDGRVASIILGSSLTNE